MSSSEQMLSSKELILKIERFLISSGYIISKLENCTDQLKNFVHIIVEKNNEKTSLYLNVRNISFAYLPNKPYIKRRQVGKMSFDDIPQNNASSLTMLLGVANVQDSYVVACWNPFYFIGHSTNRSCYVLDDSMKKAYNIGFYDGTDCKTPVLVCSENNFSTLIEVYKERNAVD